jgi:succinyl-diaminopimelate desuccinylase
MAATEDLVLEEIERSRDEIVDFVCELIRVPTVNPPGDLYRDCTELIGRRLESHHFDVEKLEATGRPEHSEAHPRVNVLGRRAGRAPHPLVHLNGHIDVVPAGEGWSIDPFGGTVKDGRIYGRGATDMKSGIAAAVYAAEAIRRAGVELEGSVEISGTVDEESGGQAGVAWLAEQGRIASDRTDFVIIPEPFGAGRICVGHRGVYWFKVTSHGRAAHGSMPFLGVNAVANMSVVLEAIRNEFSHALSHRTTRMPVIPVAARRASINVNAIEGGQVGQTTQSPCVADRCEAVFDRRFLLEESLESVREEIVQLLDRLSASDSRFELTDLMTVDPVQTPEGSPLTSALTGAVQTVLGRKPELVASPGTYDQKHVVRIAGVEHCVAYGPGILELAHQVDEYCTVEDLLNATKVLALAILDLTGSIRSGS